MSISPLADFIASPGLAGAFGALMDEYARAIAAEEVSSILFPVKWGPVYDPQGMLEHGIVHLLRHRRQIERLLSGGPASALPPAAAIRARVRRLSPREST